MLLVKSTSTILCLLLLFTLSDGAKLLQRIKRGPSSVEGNTEPADSNSIQDGTQVEEVTTVGTPPRQALQRVNNFGALSFMGIVRGLWHWMSTDLGESLYAVGVEDDTTNAVSAGRTFGKIRRLQMALIPIVFKFGLLTAMVAFLVAIAMKSLFLIKVLIVINLIAILGKFLTFKTGLNQLQHTAPAFDYHGWNPNVRENWTPTAVSASSSVPGYRNKEIHLHIHGAQTAALGSAAYLPEAHGWQSRIDPYAAYVPVNGVEPLQDQQSEQSEAVNHTDPFAMLPTSYTARPLSY